MVLTWYFSSFVGCLSIKASSPSLEKKNMTGIKRVPGKRGEEKREKGEPLYIYKYKVTIILFFFTIEKTMLFFLFFF